MNIFWLVLMIAGSDSNGQTLLRFGGMQKNTSASAHISLCDMHLPLATNNSPTPNPLQIHTPILLLLLLIPLLLLTSI